MRSNERAYLVLEDGTVFKGYAMGARGVAIGEVVFNTCTASYQKLLNDPTYYGQIVAQTYPLVGNRGVDTSDDESKIMANGYIAREWCDIPASIGNNITLDEYLRERNIIGLCGIDTRRLTRLLRGGAYTRGAITNSLSGINNLMDRIKSYSASGAVQRVTVTEPERLEAKETKYEMAGLDFGFTRDSIAPLIERGVSFTLYPAFTSPDEIIKASPDGIYLSDGPGDPDDNPEIIESIKALAASGIPIFAVGLGHQMLAHAQGFTIEKMKKGHRGSNQPVRNLDTRGIMITTQNHGYAVKRDSVADTTAHIMMENVNDNTVEGLKYKTIKAYTVQFDPHDGNGFQDSAYIFDDVIDMISGK